MVCVGAVGAGHTESPSAPISFRAPIEIRIDPWLSDSRSPYRSSPGWPSACCPPGRAARCNVHDALKEADVGSVGSAAVCYRPLVAEVSLSLVLLIAVGLLLTSFARLQQVKRDSNQAVCSLHTRAAADTLHAAEARRLLRAAVSTPVDAAWQHVGRSHRPRAADRRPNAGAGGSRRTPDPAAERTSAGQPASRVATVLRHARHPDSRGTRFRRARQSSRAARRHRQRDVARRHFP